MQTELKESQRTGDSGVHAGTEEPVQNLLEPVSLLQPLASLQELRVNTHKHKQEGAFLPSSSGTKMQEKKPFGVKEVQVESITFCIL